MSGIKVASQVWRLVPKNAVKSYPGLLRQNITSKGVFHMHPSLVFTPSHRCWLQSPS